MAGSLIEVCCIAVNNVVGDYAAQECSVIVVSLGDGEYRVRSTAIIPEVACRPFTPRLCVEGKVRASCNSDNLHN